MVAQQPAVYAPVIDIVDASKGIFNVESQSYPGIMYQYNTRTSVCDCPAGQHGRACKHGPIARSFEQGLRVARTQEQPRQIPRFIPAPDYFAELFR